MDPVVIGLTFLAIFVVELPDKTFLATLVLATKYRPILVWIGVSLAFLVQTLVAVLLGHAVSFLPEEVVQAAAGVMFLVGAVILIHRPGNELKRLTPRNNDRLLFDGIPWVARAQEEHDAFAEALRARGAEVLYLTDLLTETLAEQSARHHAITTALAGLHLGDTLRDYLARFLGDASPEELTDYLTAGIRNDEVRGGFGLVTSLLASDDFLIDPLPNLLFTRDSSVWVHDRVAITSLAMPARERETQLTELIYTDHPRFTGTPKIHGWQREHVEGGDVLLLAPGVIAVGVGERTTPAGAERLARQVFG